MREGRMLRSLSPQLRLGVYKNRLVGAVWLLIMAGVVTSAEPFIQISKRLEVSLGLLAPDAVAGWLGQGTGSTLHIILAAASGGTLIMLGILTGLNRTLAAVIGTVILILDLSVLWVGPKFGKIEFQTVVTLIVRISIVYYVIGGIRSVAKRKALLREMEKADKNYEAELKASADGRALECVQPHDHAEE
mgnify:CR=1 FL=1